jgi:hypothetical protein
MSIDSGPSAVSMARSVVSESVPGRSISAKYLEEGCLQRAAVSVIRGGH